MNRQQQIGLIGLALMTLGIFLPIMRLVDGSAVNLWGDGNGDGIFILMLIIIGLVLNISNSYRYLWIPGGIAFLILVWEFYFTIKQLNDSHDIIKGLGIGWIIITAGTLLVLATSAFQKRRTIENNSNDNIEKSGTGKLNLY